MNRDGYDPVMFEWSRFILCGRPYKEKLEMKQQKHPFIFFWGFGMEMVQALKSLCGCLFSS